LGNTGWRSDLREYGGQRTASFSTFQGNLTGDVTGSVHGGNITATNLKVTNASVSQYLDVSASVRVGDVSGGDYVYLGKEIGIRLRGETKTWEDLRFPVSRVTKNPSNSKPDYVPIVGDIQALGFDNAASEWVTGHAQMPHSWRTGSTVRPHVHWAPSKASNAASAVRWKLYYIWVNTNDRWINASKASIATTGVTTGVASKNLITTLGSIDGTGKEMSSILSWKLVRDVSHAADDFAADAVLVEFDIHYQINSFGSDNELTKYD